MKVVRLVVGLALGSALAAACGKTSEVPVAEVEAGGGGAASEESTASAGFPVSSGAPTVGGAGASSAGEAGEAGAPPTAPHGAVSCNGKPLHLNEDRVAQCVMLTGCTGGRHSPEYLGSRQRLGECVTDGLTAFSTSTGGEPGRPGYWWPTPYVSDARWSACPRTLTSCDDVLACTGFRLPIHECDKQTQARCDGDVAINCGDDALVVDCAKTTGHAGNCQVLGTGATAHAACVVKDACGAASDAVRCDGDRVYQCGADGKGVGADCAQFGLKCYEMKSYVAAYAGCAPPPSADACIGRGYSSDGDDVFYCDPNGKRYAIDCTTGGDFTSYMQSDDPPDPDFYACRPGDCHDEGEAVWNEICDGDDVRLGLGDGGDLTLSNSPDARAYVHCPDYGFKTCRDGQCVN